MQKEYTVIIEKDEEGYFVASVPELQGCYSQAKSLDQLMERIKEAILLCLEVEEKEPPLKLIVEGDVPLTIRLKLVKYPMSVPAFSMSFFIFSFSFN